MGMFSTHSAEPQPGKLHGLALWLAATRPTFLSVTLLGCLIGLATAYVDRVPLDVGKAALTIVLALLVHAGVNVLNDRYDALNGSDAVNTRRVYPFTGGSRFIQNGVLSPELTGRLGYGLLLAVIPAGIWLAAHTSPGLWWLGGVGLLLGWAYSAPPLQLMSRGLGELAIVGGWWLVTVGTDYVQRGSFAALPMRLGLPYALLIASVLYINQFPDREADAQVGKRTLVVRLGTENARWGYLLLVLLANLWLLMLVGRGSLPTLAALAAFTLPISLQAGRQLLRDAAQPEHLRQAIMHTLLACHLWGALLVIGLVLSRLGH